MELDHEFTVATDADTAWPVLLDVERLHPLMPGAVYESGSDGEYRGRLKVKFGPTTITYRGTVRLAVVADPTGAFMMKRRFHLGSVSSQMFLIGGSVLAAPL